MRFFETRKSNLRCQSSVCLMFLSVSLLLILGAVSCLGTSSKDDRDMTKKINRAREETSPASPVVEAKLKLVIEVEAKEWRQDQPIWVTLVAQNGATSKVRGTTAFDLIPPNAKGPGKEWYIFWGPVDLAKDPPTQAKGPVPFVIEAGKEVKTRIDLRQLKWGRLIQADWPRADLFTFVSLGSYELDFEMKIEVPEGVDTIRSNAITIHIK